MQTLMAGDGTAGVAFADALVRTALAAVVAVVGFGLGVVAMLGGGYLGVRAW